jgi:hypothetical protein
MPGFRGLTFNYFSILLFLFTRTSTDCGTADDEEFPKNKEGKYFIYFTAKIKSERSLWEFVKEHSELKVATSKLFEPNSSNIRVSPTPFQSCQVMPSVYMQRRSHRPHPWALTTSSTSSSTSLRVRLKGGFVLISFWPRKKFAEWASYGVLKKL